MGWWRSASEGAEHKRLRLLLEELADRQLYFYYFVEDQLAHFGGYPDVVRWDEERRRLFLGDAKDARNQTVDDSGKQILGYLEGCRALLDGDCAEVWFHIATNRKKAVFRWRDFLEEVTGERFRVWGEGKSWNVNGYLS